MNSRFSVFSIFLTLSLILGCTSTGAQSAVVTTPSAEATPNKTATSPEVASPSTPVATSDEGIAGCEITWKREAKLKALNTAVEKSDLETQSVKDGFINSSQRNRLAILSAGLIPDDVPFVSLDRSCWSEFYRAHQNLRDGKESLAKKAAEGWRVCLTANFPDRAILAENLFKCFGLAPVSDDSSAAD